MDLYHSEIRLPANFVKPTGLQVLTWSRHADRARLNDRYGEIPRFPIINFDNFDVIEVGVESDRVSKVVMRGEWNEQFDICVVVIPDAKYLVKTVWLNDRADTHRTLDRSRYMR